MEFSQAIKQIRRRSLLSQEDFAKQIGVSFTTVNRWEAGKSNGRTNEEAFGSEHSPVENCIRSL